MIKTVAKISASTADAIRGESYGYGLYNPVLDGNGNWIISLQTAQYLDINLYPFEVIEWIEPIIEGL